MINIEEVSLSNKENKNILLLNTLTMWEESNLGLEPIQRIEKRKIDNKLKERYLKISCDENYYFTTPTSYGKSIQYFSMSFDNHSRGRLTVHNSKPNVIFINLRSDLIAMENKDKLSKFFVLKTISKDLKFVNYYAIQVYLEYKNNGEVVPIDYDIDIHVEYHELDSYSMVANTIDVTFLSLIAFITISLISNSFSWSVIDYFALTIIFGYIAQLLLRTYHIGNTYINSLIGLVFKKYRKHNYSVRRAKKRLKTLSNNYNKLKETKAK